jgi:hypothetical protein
LSLSPSSHLIDVVSHLSAVEGIGRSQVGIERTGVNDAINSMGTRAHNDVVMEMGFERSIYPMSKGHHAIPDGGNLHIFPLSSVAIDQGSLLEVRDDFRYRASMRRH